MSSQIFCARMPSSKAACCQYSMRKNEISEKIELPWDGYFLMDNPFLISDK